MRETREGPPQVFVDGEYLGVFIKHVDERVYSGCVCYLDCFTSIMEPRVCNSHGTQESEAEKFAV